MVSYNEWMFQRLLVHYLIEDMVNLFSVNQLVLGEHLDGE